MSEAVVLQRAVPDQFGKIPDGEYPGSISFLTGSEKHEVRVKIANKQVEQAILGKTCWLEGQATFTERTPWRSLSTGIRFDLYLCEAPLRISVLNSGISGGLLFINWVETDAIELHYRAKSEK